MILTFHCAYKNEYDEMVDSYKEIVCNYLRGFFIVDFVALIPLDFLFYILGLEKVYDTNLNYDYNKYAKILRIGKLVKLSKLLRVSAFVNKINLFKIHENKKIRPSANKINLIKNINDVLLAFVFMIIVCHTMACSFIFISQISLEYMIDGPSTTSWIN